MLHPAFFRKEIGAPQDPGTKKRNLRHPALNESLHHSAYNGFVLRVNVVPSPTPSLALRRYEKSLFPVFDQLFETPSPSSPMRHLALDPQEASFALILENQSEKPISAWSFHWQMTDTTGKQRSHTMNNDSYEAAIFRPVADTGSRHLISPSRGVSEAFLNHVIEGGGFIGGSSFTTNRSLSEIAEVTFEIHLIVFDDGEIVGPDPNGYCTELQGRKRAAEFVARQIRIAREQGRDVTPILNALVEAPSLGGVGSSQGDPLFDSVRRYARDYLRHINRKIGDTDMGEARLRYLENRPTLPKFYRRSSPE
jgi:hypothetical protein